ncbi:hypothetical protein E2C01_010842 [Portunus trituberculatus]|uniref:Uncharacterized protein n=1 Tax=Portunus trituberculatus TaxID=210409 RepID=A0A5B7D9H8_PORTR|nr:hypothetical protein [Portunus trituberculatus]
MKDIQLSLPVKGSIVLWSRGGGGCDGIRRGLGTGRGSDSGAPAAAAATVNQHRGITEGTEDLLQSASRCFHADEASEVQGLPRVGLTASCRFPCVVFLCPYVLER